MTDLLGMNAILVLGMHRSGTSALARILNLLGCDLGPNLLPAAADNEAGFWEHRDVVLLDDELLFRLGSRWDDPRPIPSERFRDPNLAPLRARARAILDRDFARQPLWGMKDPRLCRLLPFWLPVIEEMGATPRCVLALRHPAEVARSLRARNGFSAIHSERLWLSHVLEAEKETRGRTRAFVTYDQIVGDWRTHLPRVARELGVFEDAAIARAAHEVARFVDPALRHHGEEARPKVVLEEADAAWSALVRGDVGPLDAIAPAHAQSAARLREPLVSIVVVTRNGIEHTLRCLDSVARHTPERHEVIVVDNGSTDETPAFLAERARRDPRLRVIANRTNRGFAAANNQGLAAGRGEFFVALNNDVIVTSGWLTRLMAVMDEAPEVGIVGPTTNRASGPQVVPGMYGTLAEMEAHARGIARRHAGETLEARRLVAFCWLVRRTLVERIGGFDERFETGNCEDDDFCLRAAQAGYRARIAKDCFVHHEGSATFRAENVDYANLLRRNFDLFKQKWEMDPAARPENGYPFVELAAKADRPFVALSLERDGDAVDRPSESVEPRRDPAAPASKLRLQAGILPGHEPHAAMRAFFEACGHAQKVPHWASSAALDDEIQHGDLVLILGGDVHMTQDALRALVALMQGNPKIAAIGPVSNAAPSPQRVTPKYSDLDRDLRRFSERRAKKFAGIWHDAPELGAFCLLLRSGPSRAAGGLRRDLPIHEALADLFPRLRTAGFRVACGPGIFVHHAKWTPDEGSLLEDSQAAGEPLLEPAPSGLV